MQIVNIPIESLEERYSAQWNKWFDNYVEDNNVQDVYTVYPNTLRNTIKDGDFLDVVSTVHFKSHQIANICWRVDRGLIPRDKKVVFLIQDGWFPVEQLAYLRDMLSCRYWKFVGVFHAGTYSKYDMTARQGMYTWGEELENSWFKIYDKIIVGSQHHADLLLSMRKVNPKKLHVIPWKVEVPSLSVTKENIVVFPHRLGMEKQPELFGKLSYDTFCNSKDWKFVRAPDVCSTKAEYYQLLAKSKIAVSLGLEELFGIAMIEATLLGCIPIVPDAFSYREMYKREFRYQDMNECKNMILNFMNVSISGDMTVNKYNCFNYGVGKKGDFFDRVFTLMREL
jgi:hypothetical protein